MQVRGHLEVGGNFDTQGYGATRRAGSILQPPMLYGQALGGKTLRVLAQSLTTCNKHTRKNAADLESPCLSTVFE